MGSDCGRGVVVWVVWSEWSGVVWSGVVVWVVWSEWSGVEWSGYGNGCAR